MNWQTGKLSHWNGERGYGFIAPLGGGADVFVHATALQRAGIATPPCTGALFKFRVGVDPRTEKECAIEVQEDKP